MAIAANKVPGVRAATCHDEVAAEMSRRHNDLNVLCLGCRNGRCGTAGKNDRNLAQHGF